MLADTAAHSWDLHAASKAGWRTAWTSYEEHLPLVDLFRVPDLTADSLGEMVDKIIADSRS